MLIVGIDTDAKGSVAILDLTHKSKPTLDIYAIPNRVKLLKSGKKRLGVDYTVLAAIMVELNSRVSVTKFYLEEQWSRPMQDAGATFTFGMTFGDCRTSVAAGMIANSLDPETADEKIVYVPGAQWKAHMGLSSDKDKSLTLASALFPACEKAWEKKSKLTSAAEAALLALYGASQEGFRFTPGTVVNPPEKPILTIVPSLCAGEANGRESKGRVRSR